MKTFNVELMEKGATEISAAIEACARILEMRQTEEWRRDSRSDLYPEFDPDDKLIQLTLGFSTHGSTTVDARYYIPLDRCGSEVSITAFFDEVHAKRAAEQKAKEDKEAARKEAADRAKLRELQKRYPDEVSLDQTPNDVDDPTSTHAPPKEKE